MFSRSSSFVKKDIIYGYIEKCPAFWGGSDLILVNIYISLEARKSNQIKTQIYSRLRRIESSDVTTLFPNYREGGFSSSLFLNSMEDKSRVGGSFSFPFGPF